MASSKQEKAAALPTKVKKDKSSKKRKAEKLAEISEEVEDTKQDQDNISPSSSPDSAADDNAVDPPPKKRKTIDVEEIEVDITAPEPPSKKALRALKKGKPLPPSKSGAESTPEPEEKKAKKAEVEKRSEHGIWIGNLAFHVSKQDLRTFFVEKSDITEEMITRVHMPGPNDNKSANKVAANKFKKVEHNKGFAYVDFSTAKGVEIALELSEELLSGRRVLIKDNKSFEGRPEKPKEERKDGKPPSKKVFMGNLSYDVTEEVLKDHFEKCGAIESIKVATFEDSGKCKGYAWVTFEEIPAAESAVKGFVMIEEEDSDAEESSTDDDSDSEEESKPRLKKNIKRRKWWVNKIKGRPIRMEFAEDAQVRYKKRFGKDGTKNQASSTVTTDEPSTGAIKPKKVEYRKDYAPRLTGGIVESKGSKITF